MGGCLSTRVGKYKAGGGGLVNVLPIDVLGNRVGKDISIRISLLLSDRGGGLPRVEVLVTFMLTYGPNLGVDSVRPVRIKTDVVFVFTVEV